MPVLSPTPPPRTAPRSDRLRFWYVVYDPAGTDREVDDSFEVTRDEAAKVLAYLRAFRRAAGAAGKAAG